MNDSQTGEPTFARERAELGAILSSRTFARAPLLSNMLVYLCDQRFEGLESSLKEYAIGVEALGRTPEFDPEKDSVVRVMATRLRRKLQDYYRTEGSGHELRILLADSGYVPRFVEVASLPESAPEESKPVPAVSDAAPRGSTAWLVAGAVAIAVAAAGAGWLAGIRHPVAGPIDEVRQAWAPIIKNGNDIPISVGTTLHLHVTPYIAKTEGMLVYDVPPELYRRFSMDRPLEPGTVLRMHTHANAVSLNDARALAELATTLDQLGVKTRIVPEMDAPLTALAKRSFVHLGTPWYSQTSRTLLDMGAFTIGADPGTTIPRIVGKGAQAGKAFLLQMEGPYETQCSYGLITMLPMAKGSKEKYSAVVFSGLTEAGTDAAAAFFTSGSSLQELLTRFKREGHIGFPKAYQVVVRCRIGKFAQMLSYEYVTHQVIEK